ncbi:MAG: type II secretion system F family protein [Candidatus Eiseniibacteriota bacterium]
MDAADAAPSLVDRTYRVVDVLRDRYERKARQLTKRQMADMLDELGDLLEAGLGLTTALNVVADAASVPIVQRAALGIRRRLEHGSTLSAAMEQEGFSSLASSAVKAAEETGEFAHIFRDISQTIRREIGTRSEVLKAMAYPAFILLLLGGVIVLFLTYVLPRIEPLLGDERPLATRLLIGMADLVTRYWLLLLIAGGIGMYLLRGLFRSSARFTLPVLGPFFRTLALERLFGYLGLLVRSGVHLIRALDVTALAVQDPVLSGRCQAIVRRLQHGMPLAEAMRAEPLIPPIAVQLIAVGEQAGMLDKQFTKMHTLMKLRIEKQIKALVAMVGPTMLIVSAGFILLLFFGLFLPMYENMSSQQLLKKF